MLVPSTHELKEELRAGAGDGEIADLVDDHEAREAECAQATREMSRLRVPVIAVVIGEGGSGGALGIGVANRVYMMENSVYSVISPESCAAIIWRDAAHAEKAAAALRLTAVDLKELDLIDGVVEEPGEGAHVEPDQAAFHLGNTIVQALDELAPLSADDLVNQRYDKFRKMGNFFSE